MLGKKTVSRYNELLRKFSDNDEFLELLQLVRIYYDMCSVEHGNNNNLYNVHNPYDRLILDLLLLEDEIRRGE